MILNGIDQMGNEFHLDKYKAERREEPLLPVFLLAQNGKRNFDATGDIFLNMSVDRQGSKQCQELSQIGRNIIVPLCQPIIPLNCMQFQSLHPEQKRPRGITRGLEQFLREEKTNGILQLGKYTCKERDGRTT